ncbi:MAG: cupin domain-containing protein [Saprospiraceae bacterium]
MHLPFELAKVKLLHSGSPFFGLFSHGTLLLELYKPDQIDHQTPHTRDEVYIIASGSGKFVEDGIIVDITVHDFLFVRAGVEHRFIEFTEDFSAWVIFYGPEDGESQDI